MSIKLCDQCDAAATVWFEHWDQFGARSIWMAVCDTCYHALDQQPPILIRVSLHGVSLEIVSRDPDGS